VEQPKPPEKGVFPLDHFAECKQVRTSHTGDGLVQGDVCCGGAAARVHRQVALETESGLRTQGRRLTVPNRRTASTSLLLWAA